MCLLESKMSLFISEKYSIGCVVAIISNSILTTVRNETNISYRIVTLYESLEHGTQEVKLASAPCTVDRGFPWYSVLCLLLIWYVLLCWFSSRSRAFAASSHILCARLLPWVVSYFFPTDHLPQPTITLTLLHVEKTFYGTAFVLIHMHLWHLYKQEKKHDKGWTW